MLVALLLAGRVLESRGRRRAAEAAVTLARHGARHGAAGHAGGAWKRSRRTTWPPATCVDVGAGEELPADGVVAAGEGTLRMALLTGEAEPVPVGPGRTGLAGTVLVDGALTVRSLEAAGEETVIHRMAEELRAAADRGPRARRPRDRIAPWFTGGDAAGGQRDLRRLAAGRWAGRRAMLATVAVLVVACPCALALSRPLAAAAGLGAAARRGLLLRSGDALLELARRGHRGAGQDRYRHRRRPGRDRGR